MPADGLSEWITIAGDVIEVAVEIAPQRVDDIVRRPAAAVKRSSITTPFLILLRKVVSIEAGVTTLAGIGHVHIRELPIGKFFPPCGGLIRPTHEYVTPARSRP